MIGQSLALDGIARSWCVLVEQAATMAAAGLDVPFPPMPLAVTHEGATTWAFVGWWNGQSLWGNGAGFVSADRLVTHFSPVEVMAHP